PGPPGARPAGRPSPGRTASRPRPGAEPAAAAPRLAVTGHAPPPHALLGVGGGHAVPALRRQQRGGATAAAAPDIHECIRREPGRPARPPGRRPPGGRPTRFVRRPAPPTARRAHVRGTRKARAVLRPPRAAVAGAAAAGGPRRAAG